MNKKINIVVLDKKTLGDDINFESFKKLGDVIEYDITPPEKVKERVMFADVIIVNKIILNGTNLNAYNKLICVAATGFDNIDTDYCKQNGIAVCNVRGYSSDSVAQVTVSLVLALVCHINEYNLHVKSGAYTLSGVQNSLVPVYHEIKSLTWGIMGYGGIGKKVAEIAKAFGCKVIVYKKHKDVPECVTLNELLMQSDILTIHIPLNNETRHIINKDNINLLKPNCILVNMARGAVTDEKAVADAICDKKIVGFACDVYEVEPLLRQSPIYAIKDYKNVLLTPHMSWGAYESRSRCINEIYKNIDCFLNGSIHNRVEL